MIAMDCHGCQQLLLVHSAERHFVITLLPASVINRASDKPAIPAPTIALLPTNSYAVLNM